MNYDGSYLVLDLETNGLDPKEGTIHLACWKFGEIGTVCHQFGNEYEQGELLEAIASVDFIVGHNIKFDLKWLVKAGLSVENLLCFDTQLGEYVLAGNSVVSLDLDSVGGRRGLGRKEGYIHACLSDGVLPSELPAGLVLDRCRTDVLTTEQVFLQQRRELNESARTSVQFTGCSLVPVLVRLEQSGMALDAGATHEAYNSVRAELEEVTRSLSRASGGINPRSSKQVGEFLYDRLGFEELTDHRGNVLRTDSDKRKTDGATIASLTARTQEQKAFLKLKKQHAILEAEFSKTLDKCEQCVNAGDLLYASFNQTRTRTHRLSSTGTRYGIQFQNFPRKYKKLFKPRQAGWNMVEVDGSQLEFRVAAHLGRDSVAAEDIRNQVDVHAFTAAIIGCSRQEAKAHTFKPLYGGSSGTEAEQRYYKAFKERYTGIADTQRRWIDEVLRTKQLVTETGLIFYWPDVSISRSGYVNHSTSICNYPVQYLATGEIIPIALVELQRQLRSRSMASIIVNTVHDSVVAEVPDDELELFRELAVQAFTTHVYGYLKEVYGIEFSVPLGCGIKVGSHWGEGEETKYNMEI